MRGLNALIIADCMASFPLIIGGGSAQRLQECAQGIQFGTEAAPVSGPQPLERAIIVAESLMGSRSQRSCGHRVGRPVPGRGRWEWLREERRQCAGERF